MLFLTYVWKLSICPPISPHWSSNILKMTRFTYRKSYLIIIDLNSLEMLTKSEIRSSWIPFEHCSESFVLPPGSFILSLFAQCLRNRTRCHSMFLNLEKSTLFLGKSTLNSEKSTLILDKSTWIRISINLNIVQNNLFIIKGVVSGHYSHTSQFIYKCIVLS